MSARGKKKSRKGLLVILFLIAVGIAFVTYKVFGPNTGSFTHGDYLYVHTGSDYEALKKDLEDGGFVSDMSSFDFIAKRLGLPAHIHAGKYKIGKMMSNYRLIRLLHSGKQTPVKLVINKLRTPQDFITLISTNLEADSGAMRQLLHNADFLSNYDLDTSTAMCAIMPDTYEFFWNTNPEQAFKKIARKYNTFWTDDRIELAKAHGISKAQATIVASIVEEETNIPADKGNIASVYLNRVRNGMKLQADPTVKYAVGDFTIRRIAGTMLDNPSPYNTYKYAGLPPGPICTPPASTIDAVLNSPATTYLYFCADADFSGKSTFASTYDEQLKNARAYQKALDSRGIH